MLIVRKLRLQRGWSQAELAEFSGLSVRTIQRIEKGEKPGLESLKSLAAVFDLEVGDFQEENVMMGNYGVSSEEKRAMKYVEKLKGFYRHLFIYILVVAGQFAINFATNPDYIWAKWTALGWGIGVMIHGLNAFEVFKVFGPDWEKRQVEKRLGRKL
ncbi:MAG: 2TM domain-containing protein [Spirochaetales bacterium]|nr:2TM domain-containing protein [Spirochaetales bacterium]